VSIERTAEPEAGHEVFVAGSDRAVRDFEQGRV